MITTTEAARRLAVSRSRVLELIKNGQLNAQKLSGVWLVDEASVAERQRTVDKKGGRPPRGSGRDESRYTLMNRTHELCEIAYSNRRREFTFVGELNDAKRAPIGLSADSQRIPLYQFNSWWKGRGIPQARKGLAYLLREAGADVPEELVYRNLGLSLSDQYWIRPAESGLRWEDVNFFGNDFDAVDERIAGYPKPARSTRAGGSHGSGRRHGTHAASAHPDNTSDGNLPKTWVVRDGMRMLVKGGLHNGQEPYNEVVATALYRRLLGPGDFVPYALEGHGPSAWCSCPCFVADDEEYVPAAYVERIREQLPTENDFDHYIDCCELLGARNARAAVERMITCDDILANHDRHYRNFGLVRNVETLECRPAPLFDSGSSLWCDLGIEELEKEGFPFTSQPFDHRPPRQLLLVEDLSWLDASRIEGFVDEAMGILEQNDALERRLPYVRIGLERRLSRMVDIAEWT